MKKQLCSFLSLLLFSSYAYTQTDSYDLSTYKTADYSRKSIDLTANGAGNLSSEYGGNSLESKDFGGDINAAFGLNTISRTLDQKTTIGLSVGGDYEKKSIPNNKAKEDGYNFRAFVQNKSLFYNEDNNFFEVSPNTSLVYVKNYEKENYNDQYNTIYHYKKRGLSMFFNISSDIGVGTGRIENVTDARHALFVLDELKKQGILKNDLSQDQINELASVITRVKNKRQFDSRIKLIEEIKTLDSALVANDYVNKAAKLAYYTSLYDKWMYGDRFTRLSGSRFSIGVTPSYHFMKVKRTEKYIQETTSFIDREVNRYKDIDSYYRLGAYADYTYEKPVSKKFQQSLNLRATAYTQDNRHTTKNSKGANFVTSYAWGYYPNTRTHVQIAVSENLAWADNWYGYEDEPTEYNNEYIYSRTQAELNVYYYISPQVRLSGNCGFNYRIERNITDNKYYYHKYPSPEFNLSIQYSIF